MEKLAPFEIFQQSGKEGARTEGVILQKASKGLTQTI